MPANQFPTILAVYATHPRALAQFETAVAALEQGIAAGGIANPVFQQAKTNVNRAIEKAFNEAIAEEFFYAGKWENLAKSDEPFHLANTPQAHTISAWQKKLAKAPSTPLVDALNAFMAEIAPLGEMIDTAKSLVTKRQPKAPETDVRAKYQAPEVSASAMQRVFDLLTKITEDAHDDLVQQFTQRFNRILDQFMKAQTDFDALTPEERRKKYRFGRFTPESVYRNPDGRINMEAYEVSSALTAAKYDNVLKRDVYHTRPDADDRITKMANKLADEVRESFVAKNLKKLDSIIERKGDLDEAKIMGRSLSTNGLEGTLHFTFKDGAAFTARNSVVFAYSVHGTPFMRFPLTFHDVTKSDGSKMKNPSEEKMNTEFLGL